MSETHKKELFFIRTCFLITWLTDPPHINNNKMYIVIVGICMFILESFSKLRFFWFIYHAILLLETYFLYVNVIITYITVVIVFLAFIFYFYLQSSYQNNFIFISNIQITFILSDDGLNPFLFWPMLNFDSGKIRQPSN